MMIRPVLKKLWFPPENKIRLFFSTMAVSKSLDYFIMLCIVANTVVLSMTSIGMTHTFVKNLQIISSVFTVIFNLEILIKLFGEGRHYFASDWNRFDFFIVICGNIGICIALDMPQVDFANMFIILRALRLIRIFKSLKGFDHIRLIVDTGYIIV
jgi:hypothetical protein